MDIKRCAKGHFYDAETNATCPQCAMLGNGTQGYGATEPVFGGGKVDNYGATEPVFGGGSVQDYGATEPVFGGGKVQDYGATEPVFGGGKVQDYGATEPVFGGGKVDNYGATEPVFGGGKVQDYGATEPVFGGGNAQNYGATIGNQNFVFDQGTGRRTGRVINMDDDATQMVHFDGFSPVVGWLVCVDGTERGNDYRIHAGYNYIGRSEHMDIYIRGDKNISRNKHAMVLYDHEEKEFFFGPVDGKSIVRLNGKALTSAQKLNTYDILSVGATKLMFVPLCGEGFDWNNV